ncbi:U11/U12 small nuclear ribonucleoprotein [Echinococcus granulosus]|uniref:U11/U12 small nuclear ribonucleoprotein n=2 Tax=Echinococcus granulosus TaxID=6210 RepID=W6UU80_ECHGR|nr:U11/U12 small nuclear ribonucleoprotein [Echinococcus granulosus]EUB61927.1 U11/U12 small nuclear ribonucleoprotein [Echinococcus granulosus]
MARSEQLGKQNVSKNNGNSNVVKVGLNAPKATAEQLNLARLLNTNSDEGDKQFKLKQIQECTECDLEEAILALHDADNNVQRAIENLIDAKYANDWQDTITKRSKSKRHPVQKSKPNAGADRSKGDSPSPLNCKNAAALSDNVAQKSLKLYNGKGSNKQATNGQSRNGPTNETAVAKKAPHSEATYIENWDIECGEWKGEAIEVVNSAANIPINIHDDTELLKLLTWESVESSSEKCDEVGGQDEMNVGVKVKSGDAEVNERAPSNPRTEDQVKIVRDRLFKKYARSSTPPSSHVPNTPVFFAPGARNTTLMGNTSALENGAIQAQVLLHERISGSDVKVDQDADLSRSNQIPKRKSLNNEQNFNSQDGVKPPDQCNFSPAMNTLLQSVRSIQQNLQADQPYPTPLQNASAHKETYTKIQDHGSPHSRAQTHPVNNFEGPKSYSYNLLGDLSQTVKQVSLEMQVGKTDAFTQSISSTQSENVVSAPYSMQPTKQTVTQPPQMNKTISAMPPNAGQQPLPTTQPQLHPVMHPGFPTLLSHLQPNMSLFNFPGGSGPAAPPHLFEMDHFQALQQQRMLFEMQQSQHPPQHTQTIANENSLPNASADVISSTKSTVPMHQVTTANVGSGITFLPYSGGMVLMNGYPNAYLGQQQPSQAGGSQNQSPGHGGSPLSHPSNQQQYPKSINSPANYTGYQGLRQPNFEEVGDIFYSNLAKQMAYKHTASGVQGFYNPPMQQPSKPGGGPDLSLGGKLQQQAPGLSSTQQPQVPTAASGVQPQALYPQQASGQYSFFSQPCMAMAAAAAAAQNQQQSQGAPPSGTPGPNGMDRWCPYVFDLGFYDPLKSGSIDGIVGDGIPPHDRAVCSAQVSHYRPSKAAFPENVFKLWRKEDDIDRVSLFIGRLHPSVKYEELRSALSRLLAKVKEAEAEVEEHRSRRHRNQRHCNRDRSPWQRENSSGGIVSLWPLVRVVKHPITGASRGYAFAWFKSSRDARRVLEAWRASSSLFCPARFALGDGVKVDLAQVFGDMPCWEQLIMEPSFSRSLPGWKPRRLGGGLGGMKESGQLRFGGIARPFRRPFRSFRDGEG